jgi:tRNA (cmo5U34)-methyltransferase
VNIKALRVLRLVLREACLPLTLIRTPEPTPEMTSPESVAGFHEQGVSSLLPIYHFNALAINQLAPHGARILDLGCGTGQFLAYLASRRPDLNIIGLDASADMVRFGNQQLRRAGLHRRVRLLHGDMREFRKWIPAGTDLISSIFSLHHLSTRDDLLACMREISATVADQSTRLWIFDHVRPRRRRTAGDVAEIFTPEASPAFCEDSCNSLCASWSFEELTAVLLEMLPAALQAAKSRLLPLYQIHWVPAATSGDSAFWIDGNLPRKVIAETRVLSMLFRTSPHRHL